MQVMVNLSAEEGEYFEACARIRNMSKTSFFRLLLRTIANDQLVYAILDDDSRARRIPGEHSYKKFPE